MKRANPALGDIRPADRLRSAAGVQIVVSALGRIERESHHRANRSTGRLKDRRVIQMENSED